MRIPEGYTRVSAKMLPQKEMWCPTTACVYNEKHFCPNPQICKGNGDAACHKEGNKELLQRLKYPPHRISKFTKSANYVINVSMDYLEVHIQRFIEEYDLQLDPDFQRAHVWDADKQVRFVEFMLRGGKSSRDIFFNCKGWMGSFDGPMLLVDGKQRIEATRRFMRGEIPALGKYVDEYSHIPSDCDFVFHVNDLKTRAEVLQWYLDLNDGGVAHTKEEIQKVRGLLEKELQESWNRV